VVTVSGGYPQAGPVSREEFGDYWLAHKSAVVAARHDGALVASYYLKPNFPARAAHIANAGYVVKPSHQGLGIGRAMVLHSLDRAGSLGFDAMQFNLVFASNPGRRLYESLGFREVGRIPDAVDGEDAVVYWRRL
jgi:ribosomal protein S18 acetylase RimI-like enzyme